jgi:hypothetical protein
VADPPAVNASPPRRQPGARGHQKTVESRQGRHHGEQNMSNPIPIGAKVQVERLPPDLDTFPEETQAAFRAALGKTFVVQGHGPYGHLELELGRELDAVLGGFMNTIWIEAECVLLTGAPEPNLQYEVGAEMGQHGADQSIAPEEPAAEDPDHAIEGQNAEQDRRDEIPVRPKRNMISSLIPAPMDPRNPARRPGSGTGIRGLGK